MMKFILLLKGVTETVQNEVKEQNGGFLSALLGTLNASLLGDFLTGRGAIATSQGRGIYRAGKGKGKKELVMETKWIFNTAHPLTNFEILSK